MEMMLVKAILIDYESPKDVLETLHGFETWSDDQKFEIGVNVIVVDPVARTLHVVIFGKSEEDDEIFDFSENEPRFYKGRSPYGIITKQSLFKVAD